MAAGVGTGGEILTRILARLICYILFLGSMLINDLNTCIVCDFLIHQRMCSDTLIYQVVFRTTVVFIFRLITIFCIICFIIPTDVINKMLQLSSNFT